MLSLLLSVWRHALLLASPINFRMDSTHVPGKCVNAWENIAVNTRIAANSLFATVVDGIFMSSEIIGATEYRVASVSSARLYSVISVWLGLKSLFAHSVAAPEPGFRDWIYKGPTPLRKLFWLPHTL